MIDVIYVNMPLLTSEEWRQSIN